MKRVLHLLTAAVVFFAADNLLAMDGFQKETTTKINADSKGIILKGYDAVAYFKEGKPVKGNPALESAYQGAIYLFASAANKSDFDRDPAKYAPR
jgi:YHS domain-containing protein